MGAIGSKNECGFSLIELILAMALSLIILGVGIAAFSGMLGSRNRQSSRADALTSAQAALNIMSREIGNSGYGLSTNGLVVPPMVLVSDCTNKKLHFRTNISNHDGVTSSPGEDVTFYYDAATQSVVRYDPAANPTTSGVINRVSDVDFVYYNYVVDPLTGVLTVSSGTASTDTARVNIKLTVILANVLRQPTNRTETVSSDVTLRSSPYMLGQY
jgi:prepilin-type N-terminal cleavage/methylation domain-containing protein